MFGSLSDLIAVFCITYNVVLQMICLLTTDNLQV